MLNEDLLLAGYLFGVSIGVPVRDMVVAMTVMLVCIKHGDQGIPAFMMCCECGRVANADPWPLGPLARNGLVYES